jgi:1-acyl-sn-glycerol-3-phosphate acyltransferase
MAIPPITPPKNPLINLWRMMKGTAVALFLFSLLLICNFFQVISIVFLPFSRKLVRLFNRYIGGFWWGITDWISEVPWSIQVDISGDELPKKENVLVTANHQAMTDVTTLFRVARRQGRIGDLKWFVKDALKYVPGLGWGMLLLDSIFVKRNWKADQERLRKQLIRFEVDQIPIWTLSFVEGTRLQPHKLEASIEYAKTLGVDPHRHLLLPRTKGFCLTLDSLRSHLDAVYDATIGYVEGPPSLFQWCRGDVRYVVLHIRRYPMNELPTKSDELAQWLKDRWYEKDTLLDHFYTTGQWPSSTDHT